MLRYRTSSTDCNVFIKVYGENFIGCEVLPLSSHKILMPTFLSTKNNDSIKVRVVFREAENLIPAQGSNFNYVTSLKMKKSFCAELLLYMHN